MLFMLPPILDFFFFCCQTLERADCSKLIRTKRKSACLASFLWSVIHFFLVKKFCHLSIAKCFIHWSSDMPSVPYNQTELHFPKFPFACGWKAGCCEQACGCAWLRLQSCSRWRCLAGTATCTPIHLCLRARPLRVTDHLTQVLMTSMSALHATKYIYRARLEQSAWGGDVPGQDEWGAGRRGGSSNKEPKQEEEIEAERSPAFLAAFTLIFQESGQQNTRQIELRALTWVAYKHDKTISNMAKKGEINDCRTKVRLC